MAALGPAVRALSRCGARGLPSCGLGLQGAGAAVAAHGLSGPAARGCPGPGPGPARPARAAAFLATEPAGKPCDGVSKAPSRARSLPSLRERRGSLAPEGAQGAPAESLSWRFQRHSRPSGSWRAAREMQAVVAEATVDLEDTA